MMTEQAATHNSMIEQPKEPEQQQCKNCHTPLSGPFCHQCGQPDRSIIRFFGTLIHELLEDIISIDSRAARTLFALLFKPGFLTKEYVAGRRFRYVPPLRLFLLTSIFCIFFIWVLNKTTDTHQVQINGENIVAGEKIKEKQYQEILKSLSDKPLEELNEEERAKARNKLDTINRAMALTGQEQSFPIPEELLTEQERKELAKTPPDVKQVPNVENTGVEKQETSSLLNNDSNQQGVNETDQTHANETTKPKDEENQNAIEGNSKDKAVPEAPETPNTNDIGINVDDDNVTVNFPFLSEEDNKQLSERLKTNIKKLKDPDEREDFWSDMLEVIPKLMLLLVPLFAIVMKISYPFARRYYIEHLIHAFHGHAFLFLAILLSLWFEIINDSLISSDNGLVRFIGHGFGFLEVAMLIWIPIYFLISLRVVYQQNWFLTVWKWFFLSLLYFIMAAFSATVALIVAVLLN